LPQAALMMQANLGSKAKVIQLDSACTGFVDCLLVASSLLDTQDYETALVVGADTLTRLCDPEKFMPLTIFGDGAGAVLLQRRNGNSGYGVRSFITGSDGDLGHYVWIPGGGGKTPLCQAVLDQGLAYWRLKFPEIQRWAVDRFAYCMLEAVARAGLSLDEIAWVIPHQASCTILREVAPRRGGLQRAAGMLERAYESDVRRGRITALEARDRLSRMHLTASYADLAGVECVIESVVENLQTKHAVLAAVEAGVSPACII